MNRGRNQSSPKFAVNSLGRFDDAQLIVPPALARSTPIGDAVRRSVRAPVGHLVRVVGAVKGGQSPAQRTLDGGHYAPTLLGLRRVASFCSPLPSPAGGEDFPALGISANIIMSFLLHYAPLLIDRDCHERVVREWT